MTNHPSISQLLNEEDEQALLCLENLTVDEFEDVKSGFKISLVSEKKWFGNFKTLSPSYSILDVILILKTKFYLKNSV